MGAEVIRRVSPEGRYILKQRLILAPGLDPDVVFWSDNLPIRAPSRDYFRTLAHYIEGGHPMEKPA